MTSLDAVVVGSGPNGLAAAVVLARAGLSVLVIEAARTIGGGTRTEELTLPGFMHDVCSAIHPFGAGSPFFATLPLHEHGLEWVDPPAPLAHALDDGPPVLLERSVAATAEALGSDRRAYLRLIAPFSERWAELAPDTLGPLHWPTHPALLARFGLVGLRSITSIDKRFHQTAARAMLAGIASHSMQPLTTMGTGAAGILLAAAGHAAGWPLARGGSSRITSALASYLGSLGGRIETGRAIRSLSELPSARALLFDVSPPSLLAIAGDRLSRRYRAQLRHFHYGPGVFKVDWALDAPVPWRFPACERAGTVHLGGSFEEIAASELMVARGEHPERPFVLLSQPSLFDDSRAPAGRHILWGYCHVPAGSTVDMLPRIEAQIERFAPGFRERVLACHTINTRDLETKNANMVGGDIGEGANTLRQLFFRPALRANPYTTGTPGLYLCSSSTPPGGGVHGMCGYHAAATALREVFGLGAPSPRTPVSI